MNNSQSDCGITRNLKTTCITARLMEGMKFHDLLTRTVYRSDVDDELDKLSDNVIDLLAERLKVAELYDVLDLNRFND